jgi:ABC-type polysaccharide/polyol phosphate transport system ATPase subunit
MWYGMKDLSRDLLGLPAGGRNPSPHKSGAPSLLPLRKDEFWAVQDVSFDLKRGDILGVVGKNGAGKSTLLRLVAGIFPPDHGCVVRRGRLSALIALGAGFHPHLTGRQNVYLNGTILGMTRSEINAKFEEILEFAEIGEFIDAPVATYSSGMHVRLGFAIAINVNPDVLLVDEVLSVGDYQFQRKCLDKLRSLLRQGISVILVSHSLFLMGGICRQGILFEHGRIAKHGLIEEVLQRYLLESGMGDRGMLVRGLEERTHWENLAARQSGEVTIEGIQFLGADGQARTNFATEESLTVCVRYRASKRLENPTFGFGIRAEDNLLCCSSRTRHSNLSIPFIEGAGEFRFALDPIQLHTGRYRVGVLVCDEYMSLPYAYVPVLGEFVVKSNWLEEARTSPVFLPSVKWWHNGQWLGPERRPETA